MQLWGSGMRWVHALITKLLECTHGQWLYWNVLVHNRWSGMIVNQCKEKVLKEIEAQLASEEELLEEDKYLLEINIGDILIGTSNRQEYWLLAIQAAQVAKHLAAVAEGIG